MKHLYLNLKRFDVPVEFGGVNRIAPWPTGAAISSPHAGGPAKHYDPSEVEFAQFFPEAHILGAAAAPSARQPRTGGLPGRLPRGHRRGRQLRRLHHHPPGQRRQGHGL